MRRRPFILLLVFVVAAATAIRAEAFWGRSGRSSRTSRARVGCYGCHSDAAEAWTSAEVVHRPVASEDCEACHRRHGVVPRLALKADGAALCAICHDDLETDQTPSHSPFSDGLCRSCHDPHASNTEGLLKEGPRRTCLECHLEMAEPERIHPPAENCLSCHNGHGGGGEYLLRSEPPGLCIECHAPAAGGEGHGGLDVSTTDCVSCHNPHDLGSRGLKESVHPPLLEGQCGYCHLSTGDDPFALSAPPNELCGACHADMAVENGPGVHPPAAAGECLSCHDAHAGEDSPVLVRPREEVCFACHEDDRLDGLNHIPYYERRCTECHDPHGSENASALRTPPPDLCAACHEEETEAAGSGTHPPAADCLACHGHHIAGERPLLLSRQDRLCSACHSDIERTAGMPVVHQPFRRARCTACHDPHGSPEESILRDEARVLCSSCHDPEDEAFSGRFMHGAVSLGECVACHEPHASEREHLVREGGTGISDICYGCHADRSGDLGMENVHTPAAAGDCLSCHRPHAGDNRNLLIAEGEDLCRECHGEMIGRFDLADVVHSPVEAGQCETCHDPHASDNEAHTRMPVPDLCGMCHNLSSDEMSEAHIGISLAGADCMECHDPHSGAPGLLRPSRHYPFEEGTCSSCHAEPENGSLRLREEPPSLCYTCHIEKEEEFAEGTVHPPVAMGQCTLCHSPHASVQGAMVRGERGEICLSCHTGIAATDSDIHLPVREGRCVECHDPHSSASEVLLDETGSDLCYRCHEGMRMRVENAAETETVHGALVMGDCTLCHDAHGSGRGILADTVPDLCFTCHSVADASFRQAHQGIPGERMNCVRCHEPHVGSDHLLKPNVHVPVARGLCGTCHDIESTDPVSRRADNDGDLCLTCHIEVDREISAAASPHPPAAREECTVCHDPHVSDEDHNLVADEETLCGRCHADVTEQLRSARLVHPAVPEYGCTRCHAPHGGNSDHLIREVTSIRLCESCHPVQGDFVHPVGPGTRSPVDGSMIECTTCHLPHASGAAYLMRAREEVFCITCHNL